MLRSWWVALLPGLLGAAACGGATTRDEPSRHQGTAGALGVEHSDGQATSSGPLVPLISGHLSSYVFSPLDPALPMTETCDDPYTAVGEASVIDGQSGVMYETFCGRIPYLLVGTGDQLTAIEVREGHGGHAFAFIHSPVTEGESWASGTGEVFTWHDAGSLVTSGGSFDTCWTRQGPASEFFYCRGAGLVRAIDHEFNYLLELVHQNF